MVVLACLLLYASVGWSADWPTFGGNLRRTGDAPDAKVLPPFVLKWTFDMKTQGCGSWSDTSPIIVGATLYQGTRDACGWVYALDARSGTLFWTYDSGYASTTTPSCENGRLYLGLGYGTPSAGRAIRVADRSVAWSYGVSGDRPFVVPRGDVAYLQSGSATLYAVDSTTGLLRWSLTVAPAGTITGVPAIDDDGTILAPGWPLVAITDRGSSPAIKWSVLH